MSRSDSFRPTDLDHRLMARAIQLALRGEGRVEPNPMVGCVITKGGRTIGEGFHRRFGGPHAEIEALRTCATSPRGATAYVSLEPCGHVGKTPPCADALIAAGIARVVVGIIDPHPQVCGQGVRRLRRAGIEVMTDVLGDRAAELAAPFVTRVALGRPYVIAKWAQSLDGKLAAHTGHSHWISSDASRRRVHRLRARVDAILVGVGTVQSDDPLLTAREVPLRRRAQRVVLDGRLRIPEKCQLIGTASDAPTLIFTGRLESRSPKAGRLQERGVEVVPCRLRRGACELSSCLRLLAERDVTNLLVEGGPRILTSFLQAGLVDEALIFTAPILIGGADAPSALSGPGSARVDAAVAARSVHVSRCGPDIVHRLRFTDPRNQLQRS